jgi:hypothetical protein
MTNLKAGYVDAPYHEDVVCLGDLSSDTEELHQIVELSVNVSTDCDRGAHRLDVGLFHQQLLDLSSRMIRIVRWVSLQMSVLMSRQTCKGAKAGRMQSMCGESSS